MLSLSIYICVQSVHTEKASTRQDLGIGHSVFPGYTQDTANTLEGVESSLMFGIRSPCLTAVQQCADDTGVVGGHLCFHCPLGVYSHTSLEAGESCSCLSDPLVDRRIQGQVAGDGGADVRKVEFAVVDGNNWRCLRVLYQDVRLIQASPKSLQA